MDDLIKREIDKLSGWLNDKSKFLNLNEIYKSAKVPDELIGFYVDKKLIPDYYLNDIIEIVIELGYFPFDIDSNESKLLSKIEMVVCKYFHISPEHLSRNTRKRETVRARQIAMYFSKEMTKHSLDIIGLRFGGKDHCTVIHAVKTINNLIETEPDFKDQIKKIRLKLK
jgi:hypothetical protein